MEKDTFEISGSDDELLVTLPHAVKLKLRTAETLFLAFKQVDVSLVRLVKLKNSVNQRHLVGNDTGWLLLTSQRLLFYGAYSRYQIPWQQMGKWRSFKDGFSIQLASACYLYRFSGIERYKVSYELENGTNAIVAMNGSVLREVLDILHKPAPNHFG